MAISQTVGGNKKNIIVFTIVHRKKVVGRIIYVLFVFSVVQCHSE